MTTLTTASASTGRTSHGWVPYAAIVAGALLLLESVLVIGGGNSLPDGPMIALFDVGHLLALATVIGVGLRQRRGRRALVAVGLAVALVAYVIALSEIVAVPFEAMSDAPWVGDEGPVGVLGAALILFGARGR